MDLLYLYWRVRCWRRQCLSPPRSSFFSLHSVLCALGFVHHHFTLLQKKKKNCHGSSTSHTETSAHTTLFQTSHLLLLPEQSCLSTLNQTSTFPSVLSESVVADRGGWVFFFFFSFSFWIRWEEVGGLSRCRGSRGVARWMFVLFFFPFL